MSKVPIPKPELGLIVSYGYLFHRRMNVGAAKNRPSLIVAVTDVKDYPGRQGILYLPITHSEPRDNEAGIEIPKNARFVSGLDRGRQWIITSQANFDLWPEDIAPLPGQPGRFHYGILPPSFYNQVTQAWRYNYGLKRFNIERRDAPDLALNA